MPPFWHLGLHTAAKEYSRPVAQWRFFQKYCFLWSSIVTKRKQINDPPLWIFGWVKEKILIRIDDSLVSFAFARAGVTQASRPYAVGLSFELLLRVEAYCALISPSSLYQCPVLRYFKLLKSSKKKKEVETKIWGHAWESNTEPPGRRRQRTNQLSSGNAGFWIVKYLSAKEVGSLPTLLNLGNVFLYHRVTCISVILSCCMSMFGRPV